MFSNRSRRYRLKKPRWIILFMLLDVLGEAARRALSLFSKTWQRRDPPVPRRILVLRLDHVGDVLLSTPALDALRTRFPHSHIAVLVGPWGTEVVRGHRAVDEVQVYVAPWFQRGASRLPLLPSVLREARRLRAQCWDMGIDLRGDFRNLVLLALAGVQYRIGYSDTGGGFLLNHAPIQRRFQHEVYRNLDVVKTLGAINLHPEPSISIGDDDREFVARALARQKSGGVGDTHDHHPLVAIHPGVGASSRSWAAERFAAVGNTLAERYGVAVVLTGSHSEAKLVDEVKQHLRVPFINLTGMITLKQFAALLERCEVLVTGNTGPMHLSAAVGTPVVAAFSSSNSLEEWRPFGEGHTSVRHEVPCGNCELEVCPKPVRCMDLITAEEIFQAAACLFEHDREGGNRSKR